MDIFTHISDLRQRLDSHRTVGRRIALVPTMGNLHAGHTRLITEARRHADIVACSIFVNPMQFGKNEDLAAYPRTPEQDVEKLQTAGCDLLFTPTVEEIYPLGLEQQTVVSVPGVSTRYCGASRPGHFDGVATVVSKLFNIVQPHAALFGLKDYQQFMVIQKMVTDLCLQIEIIGVETQREAGGLALSSRNAYLSADEKQRAIALHHTLLSAGEDIVKGIRIEEVEARAENLLRAAGFNTDYFNVCHAGTLEPATMDDHNLVILAAAWMGKTRLIDNLRLQIAAH